MFDLSGKWQASIGDGKVYDMYLPGTLDENRIGHKDSGANQWHPDSALGNAGEGFDENAPISTRFTRKFTFEGCAEITRVIDFEVPAQKRLFVKVDRARCLKLLINGEEISNFIPPSISTNHIFEVTGKLANGKNTLTFLSDNSYPGLPHDDIVYSSAATDETQTNWNGLLGEMGIYEEEPVFVENLFVYPKGETVTVIVELDGDRDYHAQFTLACDALDSSAENVKSVQGKAGKTKVIFENLPLKRDVKKWDEYEGNLYDMDVIVNGYEGVNAGYGAENCAMTRMFILKKRVTFGVRDFADDGTGRLALNGRRIFIRSEANCGEFPETGYSPADVDTWMDVLTRFKDYGVNLMRFHSHCPPEAAFVAADRLGMLMQPELSQWNPKNALETEESVRYYTTEMEQIIRMLANHPSFVMLTFGNELQNGEVGVANMNKMLEFAREMDQTRLFANGSNTHYGERGCDPNSDFCQSQRYFGADLRGIFAAHTPDGIEGFINNEYPNAHHDYDDSMAQLRADYKKPVFSFEVGQFEVLPDFDELKMFKGISDPVNYKLIQDKVAEKGLMPVWKQYVEATGELSLLGYRAEIEACLRTKDLSGISLLGIQDFPGQGTALVGMMNSHLEPKPFSFAQPERFRSFFTDVLPMVYLPRYTWEKGETLTAPIIVANYGKTDLTSKASVRVCMNGNVLEEQTFMSVKAPAGELTCVGEYKIDAYDLFEDEIVRECINARFDVEVDYAGRTNTYPIWVYEKVKPQCPEDVYETRVLDKKAMEILEKGGKVYLAPDATKEALPNSIRTTFTTDFWSVGTFGMQEGSMGQLINKEHPIFNSFPTEFHTNYQWWPMASTRAAILPRRMECIITEMDSYAYLRDMAQLLECNVGGGKLLFSTMGLHNLMQYPEARALQNAIYTYMASEKFAPGQECTLEELQGITVSGGC